MFRFIGNGVAFVGATPLVATLIMTWYQQSIIFRGRPHECVILIVFASAKRKGKLTWKMGYV